MSLLNEPPITPQDSEGVALARRCTTEALLAVLRERGALSPGMVEQSQRPIGRLRDALVRAYPDVRRATFVLQRAGVDVTQLRIGQPAAKLWTDALLFARDHALIDPIVAVAVADPSVRALHQRIREAHQATNAPPPEEG